MNKICNRFIFEMENEMNPLISVIVPVYNVEKYLRRCIQSITNQNYSNLELILINDGSTDDSLKICEEYCKIDSRIKLISQKNSGAAIARNRGIERSTGEYITFVDSDDYIENNMYSDMVSKIDEFKCDIVMCDCYKISKNNEKDIFTHNIRSGYYSKEQLYNEYFDKLIITKSIEYPATISNCLCLFKRELLINNNIQYPEGVRFSEDLLFGSQAMYYANNFYYMKNCFYYNYVFNECSVTNTYCENKWDNFLKLYDKINEFFIIKKDYNFKSQIYYGLLFFILNSIANILSCNDNILKKHKKIINILNHSKVREMFKGININELEISFKQKIVINIYKYRIGVMILIIYMILKK